MAAVMLEAMRAVKDKELAATIIVEMPLRKKSVCGAWGRRYQPDAFIASRSVAKAMIRMHGS